MDTTKHGRTEERGWRHSPARHKGTHERNIGPHHQKAARTAAETMEKLRKILHKETVREGASPGWHKDAHSKLQLGKDSNHAGRHDH